jgi:cell division transport system permease protein
VLFVLDLLGLIILHTQKLSDYVKENIGFSIYMKNNIKEAGILKLQKTLDANPSIKSTEYITKEQAAEDFKEYVGEDFVKALGYNPLKASIEVRFKANYANNDSIRKIKAKILHNKNVKEIHYQASLVDAINKNVRKIGIVLLAFSSLMLIIAIGLINNTIRLAVYSKRFIIRSMKLVGATYGFISGPFVRKGIMQGIVGALIAITFLASVVYIASKDIPEIVDLHNVDIFATLFFIVILLGILITWLSSYFAVRKYIKIKTDKLYY